MAAADSSEPWSNLSFVPAVSVSLEAPESTPALPFLNNSVEQEATKSTEDKIMKGKIV